MIASMLFLAACGAVARSDLAGDPLNGQKIFSGEVPIANGDVPVCASCHGVEAGGTSPLGPNLSNIGNRAARTVQGQSAQAYLHTSIVDPDAYLAGGFQEGIMYRGYQQALTPQQLNDLIAYMLTLKSGQDND
jgi:cytochrome c2